MNPLSKVWQLINKNGVTRRYFVRTRDVCRPLGTPLKVKTYFVRNASFVAT